MQTAEAHPVLLKSALVGYIGKTCRRDCCDHDRLMRSAAEHACFRGRNGNQPSSYHNNRDGHVYRYNHKCGLEQTDGPPRFALATTIMMAGMTFFITIGAEIFCIATMEMAHLRMLPSKRVCWNRRHRWGSGCTFVDFKSRRQPGSLCG